MTLDPAWEAAHAARAWGKYPHPAVVEFVGRHYGMLEADGERAQTVALDIGCGAGSCTWMLAREGFLVDAVDASVSAVVRLYQRLERDGLTAHARPDDITKLNWSPGAFDCIIDVCCLSCVPEAEARAVIERVHGWLKPRGRFLMVAAADDCDPAVHGEFKVRQATRADIDLLFGAFSDVFVGKHTRLTRRGFISEWVVEAQK